MGTHQKPWRIGKLRELKGEHARRKCGAKGREFAASSARDD